MQALDDLIVQTEIFLQYSLQSKAIERLQKIAAMFPGEEERNAALAESVPDGELVAKKSAESRVRQARTCCRCPGNGRSETAGADRTHRNLYR